MSQPGVKMHGELCSAKVIILCSWKRMIVSSIISVLMLSNTLQMFVPGSKIGGDNILDESLLERFPECSCRHVQLNSVHTPPPQSLVDDTCVQ